MIYLLTLFIHLVNLDNRPLPDVTVQLVSEEAEFAVCQTNRSGICSWEVQPLNIYEIVVAGMQIDATTQQILGHSGLSNLSVMMGQRDHTQKVFVVDETLHFADPNDPLVPHIVEKKAAPISPVSTVIPVQESVEKKPPFKLILSALLMLVLFIVGLGIVILFLLNRYQKEGK